MYIDLLLLIWLNAIFSPIDLFISFYCQCLVTQYSQSSSKVYHCFYPIINHHGYIITMKVKLSMSYLLILRRVMSIKNKVHPILIQPSSNDQQYHFGVWTDSTGSCASQTLLSSTEYRSSRIASSEPSNSCRRLNCMTWFRCTKLYQNKAWTLSQIVRSRKLVAAKLCWQTEKPKPAKEKPSSEI